MKIYALTGKNDFIDSNTGIRDKHSGSAKLASRVTLVYIYLRGPDACLGQERITLVYIYLSGPDACLGQERNPS
jgi:hypothetical protein